LILAVTHLIRPFMKMGADPLQAYLVVTD